MDADATIMRGFDAMGTRFECVLAGFDRPVHRTEAEATAEELQFLVRDWHNRLTVFDPASALSVVNSLAAERPVSVDRELFALLARCLEYTRDTRGRFDIAVGSLMRAHGFRPVPGRAAHFEPDTPWGSSLVRLDPKACTVRFAKPGVALDLGGIAKGFVLDLAREELTDLGVASALIHGGTSSVVAIGVMPTPTGPRPWRVRVMPDDPSAPVVDLADNAMSVSAPAGRAIEGRAEITHIMDPSTGRPASGVEAACVVGPSAEVCEAWSTALTVDPTLTAALPDGYRSLIRCPSRPGPVWRSHATPSVPSSALC